MRITPTKYWMLMACSIAFAMTLGAFSYGKTQLTFLFVFASIQIPAILLVYSAQKEVIEHLQKHHPNEWNHLDGAKNKKGWKNLRTFYKNEEHYEDQSLLEKKLNYQKVSSFGTPMVLLGPFIAGVVILFSHKLHNG